MANKRKTFAIEREHALFLLKEMLRIRRLEEKCVELYTASKIRGFVHLYIGEEGVAVGAMQALQPEDNIVATYREHGHEELHAELARATKAGGKTGAAAKAVAGVLHNHFLKEEEFALPPIGLLAALARGEIEDEMRDVLVMTEQLKAELPEMLREHQAVVTALAELTAAAKKEKLAEHARFAKKLMVHAQTEEEVLYPAAILIGEYLKLRLKA